MKIEEIVNDVYSLCKKLRKDLGGYVSVDEGTVFVWNLGFIQSFDISLKPEEIPFLLSFFQKNGFALDEVTKIHEKLIKYIEEYDLDPKKVEEMKFSAFFFSDEGTSNNGSKKSGKEIKERPYFMDQLKINYFVSIYGDLKDFLKHYLDVKDVVEFYEDAGSYCYVEEEDEYVDEDELMWRKWYREADAWEMEGKKKESDVEQVNDKVRLINFKDIYDDFYELVVKPEKLVSEMPKEKFIEVIKRGLKNEYEFFIKDFIGEYSRLWSEVETDVFYNKETDVRKMFGINVVVNIEDDETKKDSNSEEDNSEDSWDFDDDDYKDVPF